MERRNFIRNAIGAATISMLPPEVFGAIFSEEIFVKHGMVSSDSGFCENYLSNLNLGGYVGKLLASNEHAWLHRVLQDNPNLFAAFADPEGNTFFKTMWHGEFPGKILTGMAQTYLAFRKPETLETGNRMVQLFKTVQKEDGYLGPWPEKSRFNKDKKKWDTWGHYHCIYGLLQWYNVSGNKDALTVAIKAADCVYDYFITGKQTFASQNWAECNFAISHAFALLYMETKQEKYLEASEYIVQKEWKLYYDDYYTKQVLCCDWLTAAAEGKALHQSNQKRWESLHTLMTLAPLYRISENPEYYNALELIWNGIVESDRHNFGGFGTGEGSTGDLYGHGSETCNTIAWMAYSTEYLKLCKKSYVADELELSYFNAAFGSLLGEHDFTYMNNSDGSRESALITLAPHGFDGGKEMSCCQANGNRGISQVTEWAVLSDEKNVYLNYYGASNAETQTPQGNSIKIQQETEYPLTGKVKLRLNLEKQEKFGLNLRVPSWSHSTQIRVNRKEQQNISSGNYYVINRTWKDGDVIDISLDMLVHFWAGEARCLHKTSIYYGPVLMAVDAVESVTSNLKIDRNSLNYIVFKSSNDFWLEGLARTTDGKEIKLVDFSSAGDRGEEYTTWLNVSPELETGAEPIWNNRNY